MLLQRVPGLMSAAFHLIVGLDPLGCVLWQALQAGATSALARVAAACASKTINKLRLGVEALMLASDHIRAEARILVRRRHRIDANAPYLLPKAVNVCAWARRADRSMFFDGRTALRRQNDGPLRRCDGCKSGFTAKPRSICHRSVRRALAAVESRVRCRSCRFDSQDRKGGACREG